MAARKTRQPTPAAADIDAGSAETEAATIPQATSPAPPSRARLLLAVGLFAVWFVTLTTLALSTANPLTFNVAQIKEADLVVEATVDDPATGECTIVRTWPEGAFTETLTLPELARLSVSTGRSYLAPLTRDEQGRGYHITPTPPPLLLRLIYPASENARLQLGRLMDTP